MRSEVVGNFRVSGGLNITLRVILSSGMCILSNTLFFLVFLYEMVIQKLAITLIIKFEAIWNSEQWSTFMLDNCSFSILLIYARLGYYDFKSIIYLKNYIYDTFYPKSMQFLLYILVFCHFFTLLVIFKYSYLVLFLMLRVLQHFKM